VWSSIAASSLLTCHLDFVWEDATGASAAWLTSPAGRSFINGGFNGQSSCSRYRRYEGALLLSFLLVRRMTGLHLAARG
jgi:hypothetical protein